MSKTKFSIVGCGRIAERHAAPIDDGISTLINILPEYDLGFWSRNNLCKAENGILKLIRPQWVIRGFTSVN